VSTDHEIEVLKRQIIALRRSMKDVAEFVDVVSSPLWKRVIWWFCGFYFRKVGRWYGSQSWQPKWPK